MGQGFGRSGKSTMTGRDPPVKPPVLILWLNQTGVSFYVNTRADPPLSSWTHPSDNAKTDLNNDIGSEQASLSRTLMPGPSSTDHASSSSQLSVPRSSSRVSHNSGRSVSLPRNSASPERSSPGHSRSAGSGSIFGKLKAKFSSTSDADKEWAHAEREAARKQRDRAARDRRENVLLQRVRALEAERDAYHRGGVEFPHEELLATARRNAVAEGAYPPPYTPYPLNAPVRRASDGDSPAYTQRRDPRGEHDVNEAYAARDNRRAERRAARDVGASAAGGAVVGALLGM